MKRIFIDFSHPWFLLILIPALFVVLFPYFRLAKKYRRTRNRVTAIVLQLIVMVLSVSVFAGMTVRAQTPNKSNEVLLVVDVSDTEEESRQARDHFVESILQTSRFDKFNVGIVTFGYTQKYVVPFTDKTAEAYETYLSAEKPDTSATNIAAALTYASGLFSSGANGKIVLITDGKETDENALSVIRGIAAKNISIDAVNIPSSFGGNDARIVDVKMPDYHVKAGEECTIDVTVAGVSDRETTADREISMKISLTDNGEEYPAEEAELTISGGEKSVSFKHTFTGDKNLHKVTFTLKPASGSEDVVSQNNTFTSYYLIEDFDKVLILERAEGESDELKGILQEGKYTVTVANVYDESGTNMPESVDELRAYDQVILNNISNADLTNSLMPEKFDEMLYSYVNDYGGGLFTSGGTDDTGENANAYNRADMSGTLYQSMLPVLAVDYTPPVAVMVIVDRSGSMNSSAGDKTYLEWAKEGAGECLNALTDRDYYGLMTLDSDSEYILRLTSVAQRDVIINAIQNDIGDAQGGTVFVGAIRAASRALRAQKNVDKRHIIIVTDGAVPDNQLEQCRTDLASGYESDNITLSIVGIGLNDKTNVEKMQSLIDAAGPKDESGNPTGTRKPLVYDSTNITKLPGDMREELNVPEIKEVNEKPFYLTVKNRISSVVSGVTYRKDSSGRDLDQLDTETLGGFYGVKVRSSADLILVGDYEVPIYAQWKLGNGMVGSFMCDLQASDWSAAFMGSENARQLIWNMISNLMPTKNIRPNEMNVEMTEDNYGNKLSIFTTLKQGERIEGSIRETDAAEDGVISLNSVSGNDNDVYVTLALSDENGYSRCQFVVKKAGVYIVSIEKKDEAGTVLASYTIYKVFSYSKEYDLSMQDSSVDYAAGFFDPLTKRGNGKVIGSEENINEIFDDFDKTVEKVFDPRYLFIILAVVLFVTEIAVRKFKFKWPHELIAARRADR